MSNEILWCVVVGKPTAINKLEGAHTSKSIGGLVIIAKDNAAKYNSHHPSRAIFRSLNDACRFAEYCMNVNTHWTYEVEMYKAQQ